MLSPSALGDASEDGCLLPLFSTFVPLSVVVFFAALALVLVSDFCAERESEFFPGCFRPSSFDESLPDEFSPDSDLSLILRLSNQSAKNGLLTGRK
jgi:hypothetical protein